MADARDPGPFSSLEEASVRAGGGDLQPTPIDEDADRVSELPSSGSFAAEDFLFHLYRGSELLEDDRVGEAKEELERALAFQPEDIEGQSLLGVVYFRLGHYPRAIAIYERIVRAKPDELAPRQNLGLCYLKTGQLHLAKEAFQQVTRHTPETKRAWGYLGLCFQQLGELENAVSAFERAGQPNMAHRVRALLADQSDRSAGTDPQRPELDAMRQVAAEAASDLEADSRAFHRDDAEARERDLGRWHPVELGEGPLPPPSHGFRQRALGSAQPAPVPSRLGATVGEPAESLGQLESPRQLADRLVLTLAPGERVRHHTGRYLLLRLSGPFAVRVEHVRALLPEAAGFAHREILRRVRGRDLEIPLGGARSPLVVIEGSGTLALAAEPRVWACRLSHEIFYVREDRLVGFDTSLRHESGRLVSGALEQAPAVQLSGEGIVALRASAALFAVKIGPEPSVTLRASDVIGWIGRLLPQAIAPTDAPGSRPGLVAFNGQGAVLLDPG